MTATRATLVALQEAIVAGKSFHGPIAIDFLSGLTYNDGGDVIEADTVHAVSLAPAICMTCGLSITADATRHIPSPGMSRAAAADLDMQHPIEPQPLWARSLTLTTNDWPFEGTELFRLTEASVQQLLAAMR